MPASIFTRLSPAIADNPKLRPPQRDAYAAIVKHFSEPDAAREIGIVLPVGCGKSGLLTITPFALRSRRVLVVAPNLNIADQLFKTSDPTNDKFFLASTGVLSGDEWPEPAEIRGSTANKSDLEAADVVITNIQQLQGIGNRWLDALGPDFFDAILVDEAHHNVAASWMQLREKFSAARIVNYSATPARADGQVMAGKIVYSFPVADAMELGYVKRLRASVLNPKTLRYVRREGGTEVEVSLAEVRQLGEEDADFRRSIVTSEETLTTIVDCSIRELKQLRSKTGESRLKIIASALNIEHCIQICAAFKSRGMRADYVHSKTEGEHNRRVYQKLESHELDVIVQVRKLGEGFDHPYLSVAAVCSLFSNLSPFVQFVGRVMRVIDHNDPSSLVNSGVVVFHAGANIAQRWSDFREFSEADQGYFDGLLGTEYVDPSTLGESDEFIPRNTSELEIKGQGEVVTEILPLWRSDARAKEALVYLRSLGLTPEDIAAQAALVPVPQTKQRQRQASRGALDSLIKTRVVAMLKRHGINPEGKTLDTRHMNRSNLVVAKSAMDRRCADLVARELGSRSEWTQEELDRVEGALEGLVIQVEKELFDGAP